MRNKTSYLLLAAIAVLGGAIACGTIFGSRSTLPATLTDAELWTLIETLSEPPGGFHSENLVSNETLFVHTVRLLRPGAGVYIGVGPEQNFSFIAGLRPPLAFVVDVRRENRNLHLLYKALFDLAADRADFLSRLFSRERPSGVHRATSVEELFTHFASAKPNGELYERTIQAVRERLSSDRGFRLLPSDIQWIEYALQAFHTDGPDIHYGRSRPQEGPRPSYRSLMTAVDLAGRPRSFLATEASFAFVKDLHSRNAIVPVVGNFAGPDAIRRIGEYVRQHRAVVAAFYGSNVEVYLNRQQTAAFCRNLSSLPHGPESKFIGSKSLQPFRSKLEWCARGSR
jgi:hypothetical protein